jgi:hypothetical protein
MSRNIICKEIMSLSWNVLQNEPDVFQLVQDYWEEGNKLFKFFFEEKEQEAYKALMLGPWTNKDLIEFKHDLDIMNKIILDNTLSLK